MNKFYAAIYSILISSAFAISSYYFESRVTKGIVDAQGGIHEFFALVISTIIFIVLGFSTYKCLSSILDKNKIKVSTYGLISLFVISMTVFFIVDSFLREKALAHSADPATSQERLRQLVGYESGIGYEVDNRLAGNPSTPVDVLVVLYEKQNQIGTDMILARNSKTPNFILVALSSRENDWRNLILEELKRNPKVKNRELIFDENMVLKEVSN